MVVWHTESKKKVTMQYLALVFAVVLTTEIASGDIPLKSFALSAYQNLASVASLSAAIEQTPVNSLAQQFDQKGKELTAREAQLLVREQALDAKYQESIDSNRRLTLYVLGGITLLLLLLIFMNFYYDIKREAERERSLTSGDGHTPSPST